MTNSGNREAQQLPASRIADRLLAFASATGEDAGALSAFEQRDLEELDRYHLVMRHEFDALRLGPTARKVIEAVLKGTRIGTSLILSLGTEVVKAATSDEFVNRYGWPTQAFIDKMKTLSAAQQCAIITA